MIHHVFPQRLEDLFAVFGRLNCGEQIILGPSGPDKTSTRKTRDILPIGDTTDSSRLGFYSSGTTGQPKIIWRRWTELRAAVLPIERCRHWTWASPFYPWSFAGVQVALQAWMSQGEALSLSKNWVDSWSLLRNTKVNALSCTPTFIDLLLQQEEAMKNVDARQRKIEEEMTDFHPDQITLGGEVLRPALGARLQQRFPKSRFTVIYATAELGVLLKTHRLDGWYEIPSSLSRQPKCRINSDELEAWVGGSWNKTGDLAEFNGDWVRIIGRADAVANVAGRKVNLSEISGLAEQVPGVRRAQAVAESNPVTGQIVALRYAIEPDANPAQARFDLETFLRARLPKAAWPRRWELDDVGLGANAKRAR